MEHGDNPNEDTISLEELELLQYILEEERVIDQPPHSIHQRTTHTDIPLSCAQERLWFLAQLQPFSSAYHIPLHVNLTGSVNVGALDASLQALVQRHESLRTTFHTIDGQPTQVINQPQIAGFVVVDLQHLPKHIQQLIVSSLARLEAHRLFDLQAGPLFRGTLLQLTDTNYQLLFTLHHIITDGWSMAILVRELLTYYEAFLHHTSADLPALPIQYADYAVWQRTWLTGERVEQQLAYWVAQLADAPPEVQLPYDHPRLGQRTFIGNTITFQLAPTLVRQLYELSQQTHTTMFMVLLAAWKLLLARSSGQTTMSIGTPIAGRTHRELEGLIGCFVNTLVLYTQMTDNPTFLDLLERVREVALGAYAHQDVPFERVVEAVQPERGMNRTPLFQVMFQLQVDLAPALNLDHIQVAPLQDRDGDSSIAKFDLNLALSQRGDHLRGSLTYATDLFDRHTADQLSHYFQQVLAAVVTDPTVPMDRLVWLTPAEQAQVLHTWNTTTHPYPQDQTVAMLITFQTQRTPDALALVGEEGQITYQVLETRARHLALQLQMTGVRGGQHVGVYGERSPDLLIGMLAIFKAGGVYVPLDPTYPTARLTFMIEDAALDVLVTDAAHLATVPSTTATVLCLEQVWQHPFMHHDDDALPPIHPEQSAYLLYTSGTTGHPKGVLVPHRALANHLCWRQTTYPLTATDRFVHKASLSFDIALWESLAALVAGASTVLARPGGQQESSYLVDLIQQQHITVIHGSPSFLRLLMATPGFAVCTSLRHIFCGGESLPIDLHDACLRYEHIHLHHQYGPTETCIDVTVWDCVPEHTSSVIPIGYPIANTHVYMLDTVMQPVPQGITGELYVGGDSLSHGYLHKPALTATSFVPNPFSERAGARLYQTGDAARYRTDGAVAFMGRLNQQVKLRGYRIELGEIAAVLRYHPEVDEAIVIYDRNTVVGDRLIAYVVTSSATTLTPDDWYTYCQSMLPDYMIPAAVVSLTQLPLTVHGKVDRHALPEPAEMIYTTKDTMVFPRTPVEEVLSGIWSALLGRTTVGVHDNFFALGGHSLLATQVMNRIQMRLEVDLPLRDLFDYPTIAGVAERIERVKGATSPVIAPPLVRQPHTAPAPLSFAQQRLWFLDQLVPHNPAYNIPLAVRLTGELDLAAWEQSVATVVERHETLRTTFAVIDDQPVQIVAASQPTRVCVIDLSRLAEPDRVEMAHSLRKAEALRSFCLVEGPLLRSCVIRPATDEHIVLLTLHHIISDGWSQNILIDELAACYEAYATACTPTLPPLPVQYRDFAIWQRAWLRGPVLERYMAYWTKQLADLPANLALPLDYARPATQTFRGRHQTMQLDPTTVARIKMVSQQNDVTLFMVCLAAWQSLLYRYTGQDDISVGTPIANRTRGEIEGLIGFFVNTLVMRTHLDGQPTFEMVLRRVQKTALDAYAHQDVPFEMLVEVLQPERSLNRTPLFQVMFLFQNTGRAAPHFTSLIATPLEGSSQIAKFDLTLSITEMASTLGIRMEYNTDLLEALTITRMLGHLQRLLEQVTIDPGCGIADIILLSDSEQTQLLIDWNATTAPYPDHQSICDLFVAQSACTPDSIAVMAATNYVTYQALDLWSDQLACELQDAGVQAEKWVGICMERTPALIVGMLGILKAGGVYVPLDHTYPAERLAFILEDTAAQLVITESHLVTALPSQKITSVCLDANWFAGHKSKVVPRAVATPAAQPAYVIYTSGSTGRPKGVVITHRNAVALIGWAQAMFTARDLSGVFAATSICFDLSIFELFVPLSSGGTIILGQNVLALLELPQTTAITLLNTVPSAIEPLLQQQALPPTVQTVNLAGEALPGHVVQQLYDLGHIKQVLNLYGPSEDTTYSTWVRIPHDEPQAPAIGRPIANSQAYVLDGHGQPVPIGVAGELYLGGAGMAQGYLHRPAATAERFLPNPFGDTVGSRLYRTGDLVHYRQDGNLAFLGRIDHQVKIRGYRIELGEIEGILHQHPAVRDAVVIVHTDTVQGPVLVAYLTAKSGQAVPATQLRDMLQERLPSYMVPAALVVLDAFPRTPNGKLDRRALPAPDQQGHTHEQHAAPRTTLEIKLAQIWEHVLHHGPVGIYDDFFQLGGHSLLAVQLVTEIQRQLEVSCTLAALFQWPTVAQLAAHLAQDGRTFSSTIIVPIQHGDATKPPFFCVHPAGGHVFRYVELARQMGKDQPFYGVQMLDIWQEVQGTPSILAIATIYIDAIRAQQPEGPYYLGGWSMGGLVAFEMAQQLHAQGHDIALLALIDSTVPQAHKPAGDQRFLLRAFAQDLGLPLDKFEEVADGIAPSLEETDYLIQVFQQAQHVGLLPDYLEFEMVQQFFAIFKANVEAMRSYLPQEYPGGVTLFRSESNWSKQQKNTALGWEMYAAEGVEVYTVSGNHYTLVQPPHVTVLATQLKSCLEIVR
ncbi:MAG: hypothetical protein GFH27_549327n67 [Chloroflexi bacterium AL-W]|nr:hypothetical protein [Chloroflexi bacterium AL-N1]NOK69679.1 hypothetical protein [Chloroflexi bacterium AL-N10]NOK72226.1 hypothetical protein [Chloroflexi bacterium AL-N5]NOK85055.1 hypothetical protein [Chloroflexi bacterium AL-W]NOK91808.1 hypothetical protein [Chloroflexi bacterium AL-N15]